MHVTNLKFVLVYINDEWVPFAFFIEIQFTYNSILISGVQHNDLIFACLVKCSLTTSKQPSPYVIPRFFLLVMRTFTVYSLSSFQICNTVLLTIASMLYILSQWLTCFITGSLYLLIPFIHFRLVAASDRRYPMQYFWLKFFGFFFFLSSEGPPWNVKMFVEILEQSHPGCTKWALTDCEPSFLVHRHLTDYHFLVAREDSAGKSIRFFYPFCAPPIHVMLKSIIFQGLLVGV